MYSLAEAVRRSATGSFSSVSSLKTVFQNFTAVTRDWRAFVALA
jgi:hypothetical protein